MKHRGWILAGFALAAWGGVALAPYFGVVSLSDLRAIPVFWQIRVPRVLLAFLAGSGLAMAGMTFQALFRNPLATPFTLGVSSGAAFGATAAIRLGWTASLLGVSAVSLSAFAGALASLVLVYGVAMARSTFSTSALLLAGAAISFFFWSLILFIQYLSDFTSSFRILRWLMGGLETVGYGAVLDVLPFVISGSAVILCFTRELNLMAAGEDLAVSRGVQVGVVRAVLFSASTLMVGGVVALCGPIGFVGMMAPHICRLLIGTEHRHLAPATFLFGGLFLLACDAVARLLIAPAEIPVGVITALLGGPFFVWLLLRRPSAGDSPV
ncbi:MAG: iron ABC transporter permease [Planctomycetaceae bacterium]|nr:iron ABC transporter permease [Planctomycetaceae bacterium]